MHARPLKYRPPHLEYGVVLAGTGAVKGHIRDLTRSTDHEDLQRSRHLAPGQHGQIDEFGLLKGIKKIVQNVKAGRYRNSNDIFMPILRSVSLCLYPGVSHK